MRSRGAEAASRNVRLEAGWPGTLALAEREREGARGLFQIRDHN